MCCCFTLLFLLLLLLCVLLLLHSFNCFTLLFLLLFCCSSAALLLLLLSLSALLCCFFCSDVCAAAQFICFTLLTTAALLCALLFLSQSTVSVALLFLLFFYVCFCFCFCCCFFKTWKNICQYFNLLEVLWIRISILCFHLLYFFCKREWQCWKCITVFWRGIFIPVLATVPELSGSLQSVTISGLSPPYLPPLGQLWCPFETVISYSNLVVILHLIYPDKRHWQLYKWPCRSATHPRWCTATMDTFSLHFSWVSFGYNSWTWQMVRFPDWLESGSGNLTRYHCADIRYLLLDNWPCVLWCVHLILSTWILNQWPLALLLTTIWVRWLRICVFCICVFDTLRY